MALLILLPILFLLTYTSYHILRPFLSLRAHLRSARPIGLPIKLLPIPTGLFSFFTLQILRRLHLVRPGSKLHALLNVGRPEGYGMHEELGDVFVTVNPYGVGLVVADPKVVSWVSSRRCDFPKPPNTGAIINIYGRNVINADGPTWRFHRRVTGPAFSERIHARVWAEARRQSLLMLDSWSPSTTATTAAASPIIRVNTIGDDALRLGLHVITGAAYNTPLTWSSSPPTTHPTTLTYRGALEQLSAHLMPLFLTPRWLLRAAPRNSTWGRAWESYVSFGGYMEGMLERERERLKAAVDGNGEEEEEEEENLLTALIRAEEEEDEKEGRKMRREEVLGNAFIFLFAGHETTANTLHYALLLLALNPDVQQLLLDEVDSIYARAAAEGRDELAYDTDFGRAIWAVAVMSETLRCYTPTSVVNKWTTADQTITFEGQPYVIPAHTRIAINATGVHSNPKVWGKDANVWRPGRWVVDAGSDTPDVHAPTATALNAKKFLLPLPADLLPLTPPPTPPPTYAWPPSPTRPTSQPDYLSHGRSPTSFPPPAYTTLPPTRTRTLLKPPKGAFLPFSEGARACSGKKFATVEFVSVVLALFRQHRVSLPQEDEQWSEERVRKVLAGRKPGALTLQPPEPIPLLFIRR